MLSPAAAHAQLDEALRECRGVADPAARVACYDAIPIRGEAAPELSPPRGFGSNQLPRAAPERGGEPEELTATVASAAEREPGIYLLTLEDGSQWQYIDAAPRSYTPPRRGSNVEIIAASMGSYLLRSGEQRALRVRRVR